MSLALRYSFALMLGLASWTASATAGGPQILPHRAVYKMELSALGAGSAVANVTGRMEFEWEETCDAWTISQRARMLVSHGDGSEIDFGWTMDSWESKDGLNYRFFVRRIYAGGPNEEIRGKAQIQEAGKGGQASFNKPEERDLKLPLGTLFPTEHTKVMLEAAQAGELPLWKTVFDGTGDDGLYGVSAALISDVEPEQEVAEGLESVKGLPSWRMRLAFFKLQGEEAAEPEHEQALRIYSNGVVDELVLDYEEFSVRAILEELTPLQAPSC